MKFIARETGGAFHRTTNKDHYVDNNTEVLNLYAYAGIVFSTEYNLLSVKGKTHIIQGESKRYDSN